MDESVAFARNGYRLWIHWSRLQVKHLVNELKVVLVDDREVLGDIDIGNIVAAHMVESFVNIALAEHIMLRDRVAKV